MVLLLPARRHWKNPEENKTWVIGSNITIETINYLIITTQLEKMGMRFSSISEAILFPALV